MKFYFLIVVALFISCTKTKVGYYTLVIDGTLNQTRHTFSPDTSITYKTENYHVEKTVKVNYSGNTTIEVDGVIWEKDGTKISDTIIYDSWKQPSHALGGGSSYTEIYNGKIISNKIIEGNYRRYDFYFTAFSFTEQNNINATFTLKKN
jgi:hypothetical protein